MVVWRVLAGALASVLISSSVGAQENASARHVVAKHDSLVVDVAVSPRRVRLLPFAARGWANANSVVVASVGGAHDPVAITAAPAYGLVQVPGRHVDVTFLATYRERGAARAAMPRRAGTPLRHEQGRERADIDLSLTHGVTLLLTLDVLDGFAYTSLRYPKDLSRNIVFGPA
ncbi:MAG: hypothetical protein JOZ86_01940 [Candidatus Eremiobacteraeota bacterium]|nr:hypothetical protein [Candidatus Eremiobacteraeota bacterium]